MAKHIPFTAEDLKKLIPGDHLLYSGSGAISKAIKLKTWSVVSHISIYRGDGKSIASRDQIGVNTYPFRYDGLYEVRRPLTPIDITPALQWFDTPYDPKTKTGVTGQKYDTWGLFRFFTLGEQSTDKSFCSEIATRFDRHCVEVRDGHPFHPFAQDYDADLVSPGMFRASDEFAPIWHRDRGWIAWI